MKQKKELRCAAFLYSLFFNIFIVLLIFITNGRNYIIESNPTLLAIICIILFLINIIITHYYNNEKLAIINIISLFFATPIAAYSLLFYIIMLILNFIVCIMKKNMKIRAFCIAMTITIITIIINIKIEFKELGSNFMANEREIFLSYSPNKTHYANCLITNTEQNSKTYSVIIYERKPIIAIFEAFAGDFGKSIEANSCNIKWKNNAEIETDDNE